MTESSSIFSPSEKSFNKEIQIKDITNNHSRKVFKKKYQLLNENSNKDNKSDYKIKRQIDKITTTLLKDNIQKTKNRPIVSFPDSTNKKQFDKIFLIEKTLTLMNKKITKSNSESFLYSKIKKDNVYESFKRKIVKTAKIDLREEKCDNKKDIEDYSMQFERGNMRAMFYEKYKKLNSKILPFSGMAIDKIIRLNNSFNFSNHSKNF